VYFKVYGYCFWAFSTSIWCLLLLIRMRLVVWLDQHTYLHIPLHICAHMCCWLPPAICSITLLANEKFAYAYALGFCWITDTSSTSDALWSWGTFFGPETLIIILAIVIYCWIIFFFYEHSKNWKTFIKSVKRQIRVLFFVFVFAFTLAVIVSYRSYVDVIKNSVEDAVQQYAKCVIQAVPGQVCILKTYFSYGYALFVSSTIAFAPSGIGGILLGFNKYTLSWYKKLLRAILRLCGLDEVVTRFIAASTTASTQSVDSEYALSNIKHNSKGAITSTEPVIADNSRTMLVLDTSATVTSDNTVTPDNSVTPDNIATPDGP